jgi:hypothetical protein
LTSTDECKNHEKGFQNKTIVEATMKSAVVIPIPFSVMDTIGQVVLVQKKRKRLEMRKKEEPTVRKRK